MAIKKATAKKATAKKSTVKRNPKVGDTYACEVCGLSVMIDEDCGCVDAHDIICCSEPMKKKRARK
jgi:hypothetical protein